MRLAKMLGLDNPAELVRPNRETPPPNAHKKLVAALWAWQSWISIPLLASLIDETPKSVEQAIEPTRIALAEMGLTVLSAETVGLRLAVHPHSLDADTTARVDQTRHRIQDPSKHEASVISQALESASLIESDPDRETIHRLARIGYIKRIVGRYRACPDIEFSVSDAAGEVALRRRQRQKRAKTGHDDVT